MSYQVIARKYRPQRFSEVVGQEHVTQTLSNAITQKRIAHAYLFVGPRGTGKTTIARIFAKCLNCTSGPKVDFPDDDPKAKEIADGRSLDVLEIDGASNRGIDEIRELRDAGTAKERKLSPGHDSGYLWRAAAFTRMVERDGGVFVEMETIGLTRRFPTFLGWFIEPVARRLGRSSVERSLQEFTSAVRTRAGG